MNTEYFKTTASGLVVLAIGILLAALIGGSFYLRGRAYENTLSVTGSAKMEVKADTGKWSFDLVRKIKFTDQKLGYAEIASDIKTSKDFLIKSGLKAEDITVTPAQFSVDYDKQQIQGVEPDYQLRTRITVNSKDVALLSAVTDRVPELVSEGVYISNTSVEYFYSGLPDARIKLSGEAIKDAKNRAKSIAAASGSHAGKLQSVSGGVIQVLPPNSTDVSDYGTYDTSTIDKVISLSVRAAFTTK